MAGRPHRGGGPRRGEHTSGTKTPVSWTSAGPVRGGTKTKGNAGRIWIVGRDADDRRRGRHSCACAGWIPGAGLSGRDAPRESDRLDPTVTGRMLVLTDSIQALFST
jgi:hypothetical protein